MRRVLHPEDAEGLNPMQWLATYLKRNNPRRPSAISREDAALTLQSGYRGWVARKESHRRRAERDEKQAAANLVRVMFSLPLVPLAPIVKSFAAKLRDSSRA